VVTLRATIVTYCASSLKLEDVSLETRRLVEALEEATIRILDLIT
jgi:hypothetical protein